MTISFKPGVFLPKRPGSQTVDVGTLLPGTTQHAFYLDHERLEVPTFENAEGMVSRLVARGILAVDGIVSSLVEGKPKAATPRSVQRHFLYALGISAKELEQIQRARACVALLEQGKPLVEVAMELGYADQAHMTCSLKRFVGQTPGQIARTSASLKRER